MSFRLRHGERGTPITIDECELWLQQQRTRMDEYTAFLFGSMAAEIKELQRELDASRAHRKRRRAR